MNKEIVLNGVFWIWVGAAMLAFGYQFRGFLGPFLDLLGLS